MKRTLHILFVLALTALSCNLPVVATATPEPEIIPSATPAAPPVAETQNPPDLPVVSGQIVSYGKLQLTIPDPGVASGITGTDFPRAEGSDIPMWDVTPGHFTVTLDNYLLQGTFHQPKIYIYPAQEYAFLHMGAAESIARLQAILNNPSAPLDPEQLPFVPFFNAASMFRARPLLIKFQNGIGVSSLTQYGQGYGPVSNDALFYEFQGLTDDGKYYIIAILPIQHPSLSASFDAPIPADGIPLPDLSDPNADFIGYYASVSSLLNATLPGAYTPHIENLDFIVSSIAILP